LLEFTEDRPRCGITIVLYALMIVAVVFSIVSKIRARKTADF
jgi:putative tricarboxylic transport membrane protein